MSKEALVQAIADRPEDDGPRLVCADWLEEHGEKDRADFIRLQCRLARLPRDAPERAELERRERGLIRKHKHSWLGTLPRGVAYLRFRRGFAEVEVHAKAVNYVKKAERWDRETPLPHLFRVQLADADGRLAEVLATPLVTRLFELSLYGSNVRDEGAELLAAAPALARLGALVLHSNRLTERGVRALAASPHVSRLTFLNLGHNALGDAGVKVLADAPSLAGLEVLNLFDVGLGDAGAEALAASPHLGGLRRLVVTWNHLSSAGHEALVRRFGERVEMGRQL